MWGWGTGKAPQQSNEPTVLINRIVGQDLWFIMLLNSNASDRPILSSLLLKYKVRDAKWQIEDLVSDNEARDRTLSDFIHPSMHPCIHACMHPSIHPFIYPSIFSSTHFFIISVLGASFLYSTALVRFSRAEGLTGRSDIWAWLQERPGRQEGTAQ